MTKKAQNGQGKWQDPVWIDRVKELALAYPDWGCDRIAYYLVLKSLPISGPTVQRILKAQGLATEALRREAGKIKPE